MPRILRIKTIKNGSITCKTEVTGETEDSIEVLWTKNHGVDIIDEYEIHIPKKLVLARNSNMIIHDHGEFRLYAIGGLFSDSYDPPIWTIEDNYSGSYNDRYQEWIRSLLSLTTKRECGLTMFDENGRHQIPTGITFDRSHDEFIALTPTWTKYYKTLRGAMNGLMARGYNPNGTKFNKRAAV